MTCLSHLLKLIPKQAWVVCAIVILANFSPLVLQYGYADDYAQAQFFQSTIEGQQFIRSMFIVYGRPLNGLINEFAFSRVYSLNDFAIIRLVSLALLLALVLIQFWVLRKVSHLKYSSLTLLVLLLVSTPAVSLYIAWTSCFSFLLSMILAVLAAYLGKDIVRSNEPKPMKVVYAGGSILLLLAATLIYQSTAMYFWVIVACVLFLKDGLISKYKLLQFLSFFVIWLLAMAVSFAFLKISASLMPSISGRTALVSDIAGKANWFVTDSLVRSLNFSFMSQSGLLAGAIFGLIVLGLLVYIEKGVAAKLAGLALFGSLLLLSYFPSLVVAENWTSNRTQAALTALLSVFVFIAIRALTGRLPFSGRRFLFQGILCLWAATSVGLYSYYQLNSISFPQAVEAKFLRYQLESLKAETYTEIWLIRPEWTDSMAQVVFADEFGLPSTYHEWVPALMIPLLLKDAGLDRQYEIKVFPPATVMEPQPGVLLIDMGMLRYWR